MKVEKYSFGSIVVDGQTYNRDLILFPKANLVRPNWWRKEGHSLDIEDLGEVIENKPDILIVGRGAMGVMQIPDATLREIQKHKIKLIEAITSKACQIFNEHADKGENVVGAFHLTC